MSFKRTRVEHLERFEAIDVNRTNDSGFSNLTSLLRNFVQPGAGISWGCTFTAPGGMLLTMSAGAVVSDGGPVVFDAPQSIVFQAADGALDRIDIVTTGYSEANGTNEAREFWDDNLQQPFSQPIDTEVISGPSAVLVTTGTPSGSPTQPATPTGHVVIAVVRVNAGTTDLAETDVTTPSESLLSVVRHSDKGTLFGNEVNVTLPWFSNVGAPPYFTFKMQVDLNRPIVLVGSVTVGSQDVQPTGVSFQVWQMPNIPLAIASYPFLVKPTSGSAGGTTIWAAALAFGTGSVEEYFLKVQGVSQVHLPGNQIVNLSGDVTIVRGFIVAIV